MRNLKKLSNTLHGTALLGVTIMLVVLSILSIQYTNRMVSQYSTLVATSIEIKLNIATAHLWFEELMSGDRNESMDTIWRHIELADSQIDLILEGKITAKTEITPIDEPKIREDLLHVKEKLAEFSQITRERLVSMKYAGVGSPIDQTYDAIFTGLLDQLDIVINELKQLSTHDLDQFNFIQKALILIIVLSGSLVGFLLHAYQKRLVSLYKDQLTINRALNENKTRFQDIAYCGGDWIWEVDLSGHYIYASEKVVDIIGYSPEEIIGNTIFDFMPPDESSRINKIFSDISQKHRKITDLDRLNIHKNGKAVFLRSNGVPVFDEYGQLTGYRGVDRDITEQNAKNNLLIRTHKMDALEKLIGGLAHDYNNLLNVITGYAELVYNTGNADDSFRKHIRHILNASERAKTLTEKLLVFSREQIFHDTEVDINQLLREDQSELEKVMDERIALRYELEVDTWHTFLDKTALEDAIMNISINAKEAIPNTGSLTISTSNVSLETEDVSQLNIKPGDYVLISFTDTGIGMDTATQLNIFDPFFTTKDDGAAGLGLSQVYGFTRHSGGTVHVSSQPSHGTQISMYLPRYIKSDSDKTAEKVTYSSWSLSGHEAILVVDEEEALRNLADEVLSLHGYRVWTAESGESALKILETEAVDLLFSDVTMQDMDGYELAAKARKISPDLKIQIVSAYGAMRHTSKFDDALHQQRLQKPYSTNTLLHRIRELLDRK